MTHRLRADLERDGYCIIPGLLTSAEASRIRTIIGAHLNEHGTVQQYASTQPNAAVEIAELAWVFHHPSVVQTFRDLFGDQEFLFTWHADAHRDMPSDWHRDDGSSLGRPTGYFDSPQYVDECRVYKMALYLNDHRSDGRGLTVRRGSHVSADASGEEVYLPTQAGDAVVFDVRLAHRGSRPDRFERLLRRAGRLLGDEDGTRRLGHAVRRAYFHLRGRQPKLSVFFTFGASNQLTTDFARNSMARQLQQTGSAFKTLPVALADGLAANGVAVAPLP